LIAKVKVSAEGDKTALAFVFGLIDFSFLFLFFLFLLLVWKAVLLVPVLE
jgi:hypothetical protein